MNNINKEEAAGIVMRILMALKVPGNWAKVLAGALIGALGAWMGLTQTSCTSTALADPPGRVGINIPRRKGTGLEQRHSHTDVVPVPAYNG